MNSINISPLTVHEATRLLRPVVGDVWAGFPSPADDFQAETLDLAKLMISNPIATFYLRVRGESMKRYGIFDGDYAVVDRSVSPKHGSLVVASLDNLFTLKRLHKSGSEVRLLAGNPDYPDLIPRDGQTLEVWGVVTWIVRDTR